MIFFNKLLKIIKSPHILLNFITYNIANKGYLKIMDDKQYLELMYYILMKKKLNPKNPSTFNEKIQWLKLYDRKPEYTIYADKYAVRQFIKDTIGEEYLIPLLGVYNSVEEIKWDKLPNQFVLKCTHASGANIICSNKTKLNIDKSKKKLKKWMRKNWFWYGREWCYKNIKPRIICEKFMVDESGVELKDYKFMCFNGVPKIIQVMSNRNNRNYNLNHFDLNWDKISINRKSHKENKYYIKKPEKLGQMIEISKKISKKIPFARIDFYSVKDRMYFGEITLTPTSGYMDFENEKDNYLLGSWIKLPDRD
jgi:hypothetical protein